MNKMSGVFAVINDNASKKLTSVNIDYYLKTDSDDNNTGDNTETLKGKLNAKSNVNVQKKTATSNCSL